MSISEPIEITEPVQISEPAPEGPMVRITRSASWGNPGPFIPVAAPVMGRPAERTSRGWQAVGEVLAQAAAAVGLGHLVSFSARENQVPSAAVRAAWERAGERGIFSWANAKASFGEFFDRSTAKARWLELGGFVVAWTALGVLFDRAHRHGYNEGVDEGVRSTAQAMADHPVHHAIVSITRQDDNGKETVILARQPQEKISLIAPEGTLVAPSQQPTI